MKVLIKKWGNSASVRIPASIMAAAKLRIDEAVEVREESGRIILEPVYSSELEGLIAGITTDNLHTEVNFGPAVGQEWE
jgi:antitoxin MazE